MEGQQGDRQGDGSGSARSSSPGPGGQDLWVSSVLKSWSGGSGPPRSARSLVLVRGAPDLVVGRSESWSRGPYCLWASLSPGPGGEDLLVGRSESWSRGPDRLWASLSPGLGPLPLPGQLGVLVPFGRGWGRPAAQRCIA